MHKQQRKWRAEIQVGAVLPRRTTAPPPRPEAPGTPASQWCSFVQIDLHEAQRVLCRWAGPPRRKMRQKQVPTHGRESIRERQKARMQAQLDENRRQSMRLREKADLLQNRTHIDHNVFVYDFLQGAPKVLPQCLPQPLSSCRAATRTSATKTSSGRSWTTTARTSATSRSTTTSASSASG